MVLVKEYWCGEIFVPDDRDIQKGIKIAKKDHCIVKLVWCVPYNGLRNIVIDESMDFSDAKDIILSSALPAWQL